MSEFRVYTVRYCSFNCETKSADAHYTECFYQRTPLSHRQILAIRRRAYNLSLVNGKTVTAQILRTDTWHYYIDTIVSAMSVIAFKSGAFYNYFAFHEDRATTGGFMSDCAIWTRNLK